MHPDINKGHWSKEENDKLKGLVNEHGTENWDLIAQKLGTKYKV
mgnify:CR=1 FL=1